jgi:hypothetical protein
MSRKPQHAVLTCFIFFLALSLHSQAHADTYQLFQFNSYNGAGPVLGIDNAGDALYRSPCADTTFNCYSVFQPFGPGFSSTTLPSFAFDNGAPCLSNPQASFGVCNSGFEAYWISPSIGGSLAGVYVGPPTDLHRFFSIPANSTFFYLNSFGDLAWTDGGVEINLLAYNVTAHQTPEPSTLALLTTGLVFLTAFTRRKLTSPS